MSNTLFYIVMALGLSGAFLVLFCPCGILMYCVHLKDRQADRLAAREEAARQAHIQQLMKLGETEISAMIAVDGMRAGDSGMDSTPPSVPQNTPSPSPRLRALDSPPALSPINFSNLVFTPLPSPMTEPPAACGATLIPPPPNNSPVNSPIRNFMGQNRSRQQGRKHNIENLLEQGIELQERPFGAYRSRRETGEQRYLRLRQEQEYLERSRLIFPLREQNRLSYWA